MKWSAIFAAGAFGGADASPSSRSISWRVRLLESSADSFAEVGWG